MLWVTTILTTVELHCILFGLHSSKNWLMFIRLPRRHSLGGISVCVLASLTVDTVSSNSRYVCTLNICLYVPSVHTQRTSLNFLHLAPLAPHLLYWSVARRLGKPPSHLYPCLSYLKQDLLLYNCARINNKPNSFFLKSTDLLFYNQIPTTAKKVVVKQNALSRNSSCVMENRGKYNWTKESFIQWGCTEAGGCSVR